MNFVEAAIELLKEAGAPVHVTHLCEQAVERGLLDRPGTAPLRSMKGRLTTELKKGDESRVVKTDDDTWALRAVAEDEPEHEGEGDEGDEGDEGEGDEGDEGDEDDEDEGELTEEEKKLAELYGDEQSVESVVDRLEYRDERTADEDRAMLPEIKADRRGRQRRERERGRRERRPRRERGDRDRDRGRSRRSARTVEPASDSLADRAYAALASKKNGSAINVKDLAQSMKKHELLSGDPSDSAPLIKAALLADSARRLQAGLRPRTVYRGKGLFAALQSNLDDDAREADRALADAARQIDETTRTALARRLATTSQQALERVGYLFLEATGWRKIEWVKRVGPSSYATARNLATDETWLISVRGGKGLVDRRGVGELRAGVKAKDLPGGLLLSPTDLGDEARAELARGGRTLSVLCGDAWISALVEVGVGVVAADLRVHYLDSELLDAL